MDGAEGGELAADVERLRAEVRANAEQISRRQEATERALSALAEQLNAFSEVVVDEIRRGGEVSVQAIDHWLVDQLHIARGEKAERDELVRRVEALEATISQGAEATRSELADLVSSVDAATSRVGEVAALSEKVDWLRAGLIDLHQTLSQISLDEQVGTIENGLASMTDAVSALGDRVSERASAAQMEALHELVDGNGILARVSELVERTASLAGAEELSAVREEVVAASERQVAAVAAIEGLRDAVTEAPSPATASDVAALGHRLDASVERQALAAVAAVQEAMAAQLRESQGELAGVVEALLGHGATAQQLVSVRDHLSSLLAEMKQDADAQRAGLASADVVEALQDRIRATASAAQLDTLNQLVDGNGILARVSELVERTASLAGAEELSAVREEVVAASERQVAAVAAIEGLRDAVAEAPSPATASDVAALGHRLDASVERQALAAVAAVQEAMGAQLRESQGELAAVVEALLGHGATAQQLVSVRDHLSSLLAEMKQDADAQRAGLASADVVEALQDRIRATASAAQVEAVVDRFDSVATASQLQTLRDAVSAVIDDPAITMLTDHVRSLAVAQRSVSAQLASMEQAIGSGSAPADADLSDLRQMVATVASRPLPASLDDIRSSVERAGQRLVSGLQDDLERRLGELTTVQDLRELRGHLEALGDEARREIRDRLSHVASERALDNLRHQLANVATSDDVAMVIEQFGNLPTVRQLLDATDLDVRLDRISPSNDDVSSDATRVRGDDPVPPTDT